MSDRSRRAVPPAPQSNPRRHLPGRTLVCKGCPSFERCRPDSPGWILKKAVADNLGVSASGLSTRAIRAGYVPLGARRCRDATSRSSASRRSTFRSRRLSARSPLVLHLRAGGKGAVRNAVRPFFGHPSPETRFLSNDYAAVRVRAGAFAHFIRPSVGSALARHLFTLHIAFTGRVNATHTALMPRDRSSLTPPWRRSHSVPIRQPTQNLSSSPILSTLHTLRLFPH